MTAVMVSPKTWIPAASETVLTNVPHYPGRHELGRVICSLPSADNPNDILVAVDVPAHGCWHLWPLSYVMPD